MDPVDAAQRTLVVWDYVVFGVILAISIAIGVFYACSKKNKLSIDFFLAGRDMGSIPVAFSMVATFMSAITLLGNPAEIYTFGTQYMIMGIPFLIMPGIVAHIYLPVYFNLQLSSMFEYIELRFNKSLRLFCCFIFIIQMLLYMAVVLYSPALTFNVVTGLNRWILVILIGVVCIFYTTIGGMKAVLWTDVFQCLMMFGGLIAVLARGAIDQGGFSVVWDKLEENKRVQFFLLNPDPTVRHTFWGLAIGGIFHWTASYASNQAQIQRLLCIKTLRKAQVAMWLNSPGLLLILIVGCLGGAVLNAEYMGCDPILTGRIKTRDQLIPLYVIDRLSNPGLPGFYVACIFCAGLSTISSGLNSLAAVTVFDLIKQAKKDLSEKAEAIINKLLVLGYGCLMIALSYFGYLVPGILQAAIALFGITAGPMFGVFTLGILCPCVNSAGAWSGLLSALAFMIWVSIGGNTIKNPNPHPLPVPPQTMDNCTAPYNNTMHLWTTASEALTTSALMEETTTMLPMIEDEGSNWLPIYGISYIWYATFTTVICVVVGLLVSFITCCNKGRKFKKELFHPMVGCMCGYPEVPDEEDSNEAQKMDDYPAKKGNHYTVSNNFDHVIVGAGHVENGNHVEKKGADISWWNGDVTAL